MNDWLIVGAFWAVFFVFMLFSYARRIRSHSEVGPSLVETHLETCRRRDRKQSFDEWASNAIELMAVDQVESGNLDFEMVTLLREKYGDSWELFYPKAMVEKELSHEGYWTALKKFDDKVARDNGEDIVPSVLDKIMSGQAP